MDFYSILFRLNLFYLYKFYQGNYLYPPCFIKTYSYLNWGCFIILWQNSILFKYFYNLIHNSKYIYTYLYSYIYKVYIKYIEYKKWANKKNSL